MAYISDIDPQQVFKELYIASQNDIPVLFYTWFGPGCAVSLWQTDNGEEKNWTNVKGPIELFIDGITDSDEKSKLSDSDFTHTAQVLKCAPCYQTIIDLNIAGQTTLESISNQHHNEKDEEEDEDDKDSIQGALVYFVAWSSASDAETAKQKWETNYQLNTPYAEENPKRVPFIWFGDLIDRAADDSEEVPKLLEEWQIEDFKTLKTLEAPESEHESDTLKELRRNLKRASGAGDLPHHTSAVITGKEILALLLRRLFGGVTADTTVLPAWVGEEYDSKAAAKSGERFLYGDIADEKSWRLVAREEKEARVTSSISKGLQALFKRQYSSGPTQHRNTGGVVYEGQPRDVTTITGYVLKPEFKVFKKTTPVVLTYDFKTIEGNFFKFQENNTHLMNADLIDVFCNYTPYSKRGFADTAFKVFLVGMTGMREGENENLLTYNAFRGPATLSAAMTEYVISQMAQGANFCERNRRGFGRTLVKTGRVVDVTYYSSSDNNLPILGYGESRNPTPDQMRQGGRRRDIIGKDGYMLLLELNLVKIWSGTWKASTEFAVPVTPRGMADDFGFDEDSSDEDSNMGDPGDGNVGGVNSSNSGASEKGSGDPSSKTQSMLPQPPKNEGPPPGAFKRKRESKIPGPVKMDS